MLIITMYIIRHDIIHMRYADCISQIRIDAENRNIYKFLNHIPHGIFFLWTPGGFHLPLWKIHFGVSEPNSFLHRHLYIYRHLKSKRTRFYLQNSRDEVRSNFGRKLDKCVENSKFKNLRCRFGGQLFPRVAKN